MKESTRVRARVRVFVCICVCACECARVSLSLCLYTCGVGAEVCVFVLINPGDCDVSIPVVVGNSILNQLILVMMMLQYRVLWDSYTRPANLDDGDDGWVRGPEVLPLSIHPRGNVDFEMACVSGHCLPMRAEQ